MLKKIKSQSQAKKENVSKNKNAKLKTNQIEKNIENTSNEKPQIKAKKPAKKAKGKAKLKSLGTVTQVKSVIPKALPDELIIEVKNLPKKCKQIDLVKSFNKFGTITYIQIASKAKALIAFLQPEEAKAAIKGGRNILIRKTSIKVKKHCRKIKNKQSDGRTAFVFRADPKTTIDDVKEHFKNCGKIKSLKLSKKKVSPYFIIEFEEELSGKAALKLHNTVLKEKTIHVRLRGDSLPIWDLKRTIVLSNSSGLEKIDGSIITNIFKDCGEIESCDVFCDKNRLAILTFKNEDSIPKALRLNGTTKHGLNLEVQMLLAEVGKSSIPTKHFEERENLLKKSKKSKVIIEYVGKGLSDKDIFNLFNTCGPVKSVTLSDDRSAVVEFENSEGYCKAFLLHSYKYGGKTLLLKPFSEQELPKPENKKPEKRNALNEGQKQNSKKFKR